MNKVYVIVRSYYDFCDFWETDEEPFYLDKEKAEYEMELKKEQNKDPQVSFFISEYDIDTSVL